MMKASGAASAILYLQRGMRMKTWAISDGTRVVGTYCEFSEVQEAIADIRTLSAGSPILEVGSNHTPGTMLIGISPTLCFMNFKKNPSEPPYYSSLGDPSRSRHD